MTETVHVPGYGRLDFREILKEDLIDIWQDIVENRPRREYERDRAFDQSGQWRFHAAHRQDSTMYHARSSPSAAAVCPQTRREGEDSPHVAYGLREPEAFSNDRILVVGGGDSAVEAALALAAQPGNRVAMSYRGSAFARIKESNRRRIDAAIAARQIAVHWSTTVAEIAPGAVGLSAVSQEGPRQALELPIDRIFVFIGGELPTAFLRDCGVQIDVKFGTP
jgi:hypothetical protein